MRKVFVLCILLFLFACSDSPDVADPDTAPNDNAAATAVPAADTPANEPEAATPEETVTLRMIAYDFEMGSYNDLIETFEAENPGVEIKMVSVEETLGLESGGVGQWPEDTDRRIVSAADILSTNVIGVINSGSGLLLDLRPLAEADTNFNRADFYPNAVEYFESDGGLWGIPTELNFSMLFYNKDAFDAAGVAYPQPGWSWDDFLAAAQATTVLENGEVTQWGLVQVGSGAIQFVLPRTGPIINNETDPPTVQIDRPEVAEMLRWYTDLFLLHEVTPILQNPEPDEDGVFFPPGYQLIEEGKAAMWPEYSGSWEWRSQQGNVGIVPFPVDAPEDRTSEAYVTGYMVSSGTLHPELAWRWINFLSQQPTPNEFNQNTAVPARRSLAEASGFWDRVAPEYATALQYALDHAYTLEFTAGYGPFLEATEAILLEGLPIEEALVQAQERAETAIADFLAEQENAEQESVVIIVPEEEIVPEGGITIVFMAASGSGGLQPYRDLVPIFQQTHPDIVVDMQTPNFGAGNTYLRSVAADSDCLQWFGSVTNEADRAAVLNMAPFLDADPEVSPEDFYPSAVEQFSYQGQLWAIPAEMNLTVLYYNKALFDEAALPYPSVGWTTDDFLAAAVALTRGDDPETKQYGYVPQEFELNEITMFMERLGAQLVNEAIDPPQLTFTDPSVVEAMRWLTGLTTEHGVKPVFITDITGSSSFAEERNNLIENGRAAMWVDQGFDSFPELDLSNLNVGIVPLPTGPDGTAVSTNSITGYYISAQTEQRQACWEWIKFLTDQPIAAEFGNTIPAKISVADSDAYTQVVGAELAAANRASVAGLSGASTELRLSASASWLSTGFFWWQAYAYDQILQNGVPVEEALADVQAKADLYRECVITNNAQEDPNGQSRCLGQVDETVPDFFIETDDEE
jgi:multiple sugar transport system substrate-binding protein